MKTTRIKGLTLHRPWGHAIANLGKDVENRTWNCPLQIGTFIAIHNGKKWDDSGVDYVRQVTDIFDATMNPVEDEAGSIIAIAQFDGNITVSDSPWFCGPIGWKLKNVVAIEPIQGIKGQQRLWDLDAQTLTILRQRWVDRAKGRS